jgi:DNA-binding transcriptional regulator YiaG
MRKSIAASITETVRDLHNSGSVDDITMGNIMNLCAPEVQEYTREHHFYKKKFKLSQAALASLPWKNSSLLWAVSMKSGAQCQQYQAFART